MSKTIILWIFTIALLLFIAKFDVRFSAMVALGLAVFYALKYIRLKK